MTKDELKKMVEDLRARFQIAPHEVVLVGEQKDKKEPLPDYTGDSEEEAKEYVLKNFKFTRNSIVKEDAQKLNQKSNKFFHLLVAQPSGETIILPGTNRKVKRSNRTNKYGWHTLFERENITFDEIKTEVVSKAFTVVGSPVDGKIRLTDYVLMGAWIEADCGFRFKIHTQDKTGKFVPLESYKRNDEGKLVKSVAEDRLVRFFVLETQYETLETLLANRIEQAEKYKISAPATHSDPDASKVVIDSETAAEIEEEKEADI
jgi:hypothetical protein